MKNRGAEVYNFSIRYGSTTLPFGNGGDPEFGARASRTYSSVMPIPDLAIADWELADGTHVHHEIQIRRYVSDPASMTGANAGTIYFEFEGKALEVFVDENLRDGKKRLRVFVSNSKD
jgi:hypothetical protein